MAAKSKKRTKLPIDFKKLMESVESVSEAREQFAYVDVVIDVTASDRLIDAVLEAFAPLGDNAQVSPVLMEGKTAQLSMPCDLCVVVGGESLYLGEVAASARRLGCPTVVVVEAGETYFAETEEEAAELLGEAAFEAEAGVPVDDIVDVDFADERPLDGLARWIAVNAPAKRLSLVASFAFMRMPLSMELTERIALQNAGVGLVVIVPGADMPVITLNQAKLVLQIAGVYGQPIDQGRILEIGAVVAGAFGFRALARELSGAVPALGWGIKGAVAYTGTLAMGKAAVEYFEEGGRINGLASKIRDAVDVAVAAAEEQFAGVDEPDAD